MIAKDKKDAGLLAAAFVLSFMLGVVVGVALDRCAVSTKGHIPHDSAEH